MGTEKPKLLIDIQKQIYYYQVCLIGCILVFLYLCVLQKMERMASLGVTAITCTHLTAQPVLTVEKIMKCFFYFVTFKDSVNCT